MSKHVLISGFEITVGAWVGDTEDGTVTRIAGQQFSVRPRDLAVWVDEVWPLELEKLKMQLSLAEMREAESVEEAEPKTTPVKKAGSKASSRPSSRRRLPAEPKETSA